MTLLIKNRKSKILSPFRSSLSSQSSNSNLINNCENDLHSMFRHYPTLKMVQKFVKKHPYSVYETNYMGHLPLQTALIYASTPDIIRFLIEKNDAAAKSIDVCGKTSLHLALDGYERMGLRGDLGKPDIIRCFDELIEILCSHEPSYINAEDENEMNVLEYAIEKEVSFSIVRRLQRISENILKGISYCQSGEYMIRDSKSRERARRSSQSGRKHF